MQVDKSQELQNELIYLESGKCLSDFFNKLFKNGEHFENYYKILCNNKKLPCTFFEEKSKEIDIRNKYLSDSQEYAIRREFFKKFSIEYCEKYTIDFGAWNLSSNENLSPEFIEKNFDSLIPEILIKNPALSLNQIKKHIEVFSVEELILCPNMTFDFLNRFCMDRNINNGVIIHDWYSICANYNYPCFFIDKCMEILHIGIYKPLYGNPNMTFEFYEKYLDIINWEDFCETCNIAHLFYQKYPKKIVWKKLCGNLNIPESFFSENCEKIGKYLYPLTKNKNIPLQFYENNFREISWEKLDKKSAIFKNLVKMAFDEEQIYKKVKKDIDLSFLKYYNQLYKYKWFEILLNFCFEEDSEFREKMHSTFWIYLCENQHLSFSFFDNHIEIVNNKKFFPHILKNEFKYFLENEIKQVECEIDSRGKYPDVFYDINTFVYSVPSGIFGPLPKGGYGYREFCEKYS